MAETKLIRDHHLLTRNLRLNDNYISNDGGDEGIAIDNNGNVNLRPQGQDVFDFEYDRMKIKWYEDADDYLEFGIGSGGVSTIKTYADPDNNAAQLNIEADGNLILTGSGSQGIQVQPATKTTSGLLDASASITETLNLPSGAGGSDVHHGLRYSQTQTDLTGWDSVYLMHLSVAGSATKVVSVDKDAKLTCPVLNISNTSEDGTVALIDYDYSNTTAALKYGLRVDVDRTGDVSSSIDTTYGQFTTVDTTGASGGTIHSYGHRIAVTGDTGGTSKAVGLHVVAQSADENYAIITAGGNVGIGVNDPDELLEIAGDTKVSGSNKLYIYDSGGEYISGDGTDLTITSGRNVELAASNVLTHGSIQMKEISSTPSASGVDTYGFLWIKNTDPTELWFTNDDGDDIRLTSSGLLASASAVSADDITVGDAQVNIATSSGDIVFKDNQDNGTHEFLRLYTSQTAVGTVSEILGPDNNLLAIRAQGNRRPLQLTAGGNVNIAHGSSSYTGTDTGVLQRIKGTPNFSDSTCDWDASPGLDDGSGGGTNPANIQHDDDNGKIHVGLQVEAEDTGGIGQGGVWESVDHVQSDTFFRISKNPTPDATNATMNFREPGNVTYLTTYKKNLQGAWQANVAAGGQINPVTAQASTSIPAQYRGPGSGSKAIFLYGTNKDGQPWFRIVPNEGGYGYTQSFTFSCNYNHTTGLNDDGTTGDSNDEDKSLIFHADDDGAIKLYMSVEGDGIPLGAYVGEVDGTSANAWFRIHLDGGTGSIDTGDREPVTLTKTGETLTFREKICIQDAGSTSNHGYVEAEFASDGHIALGTQTTSQAGTSNRSIVPSVTFDLVSDDNKSHDEMITSGQSFKMRGSEFQLDYPTIFMGAGTAGLRTGQDWTNIHMGDRFYWGNAACNNVIGMVENNVTESSQNKIWLFGDSLTNGVAFHNPTLAQCKAAKGLEIKVDTQGAGEGDAHLTTWHGGLYLKADNHVEIQPGHSDSAYAGQKYCRISKEYIGTTNATDNLLFVEYNSTGDTASGQTTTHQAINIDLDGTGNDGAGTATFTGIDVNVTADGSTGVKYGVGLDVNVSGGDIDTGLYINTEDDLNNYGLKLVSSADTGDFFAINTHTDGATYIYTKDDGNNEAAHLTFVIEGDTIFKGDIADGTSTEVCRIDASASSLLIASGKKIEFADTGEYITSDGTDLTIASGSNLILDSTGAVTLDSANGQFIAKRAGTEFSAANSAYAGMILGFTEVFDDSISGEDLFQATTTSFVNLSLTQGGGEKYLKVAFVVPPSNKVLIKIHLPFCGNIDGSLYLGLATDDSATTLHEDYERSVWDVDESDTVGIHYQWVIHGSDHSWASGESKTLYAMVKEGTAGGRIYSGDGSLANYGAWTMEAVALPTTIADGS